MSSCNNKADTFLKVYLQQRIPHTSICLILWQGQGKNKGRPYRAKQKAQVRYYLGHLHAALSLAQSITHRHLFYNNDSIIMRDGALCQSNSLLMQSDTYQIQVDNGGLKRVLLSHQEGMHPVCFMLSEIVASACSHSHRQGYK